MLSGHRVRHRAGVLGSPIAHSLSPVLHNAAYAALGLDDWRYDATLVGADQLLGHVAGLDSTWRGLSLTMPLKEEAFAVADQVSDLAGRTGSINTLVRVGADWHADNTDVHGIVAALEAAAIGSVRSAVVIGSGATARSALAALARLGVTEVALMVRAGARVETLAQARAAGIEVTETPLGVWPAACDLVVNTLPAGAAPQLGASLPAGESAWLEVGYASGESTVVAAARTAGYAVVPGTEMLLHQAGEQVRLMTGHQAPLSAMRDALESALAVGSE